MSLREESEKLKRSWMRHDAAWLRDYLVASVEDPRLNIQSIFSRHFILRAFVGERLAELMHEECRFAAAMNWLMSIATQLGAADDFQAILRALRGGMDNFEGIEIPRFLLKAWSYLPGRIGDLAIPNYLESFLQNSRVDREPPQLDDAALNTFVNLWRTALSPDIIPMPSVPLKVLEPACGSANDYRFLAVSGISQLIDYSGFDLCDKNIENARALFPEARFKVGNVFEISASDRAFDLCFFHDLLEHLSLEGLETAVREICRVTSRSICAGFFQLDEIAEHIVRPVEDYHINTLSLDKVRALFAAHGFSTTVIHVGSFLRHQIGCEHSYNPNAYTLVLSRNT